MNYNKLIDEFNNWISQRLESFQLNDDVYINYIHGIFEEEGTPIQEKVEGILEFLIAATVC